MSSRPIGDVLQKLPSAKPTGERKWLALCPAHDDHRPSLRVREEDDGSVSLTCYAGCARDRVCAALGLQVRDLRPDDAVEHQRTRRSGKSSSKRYPTPEAAIEAAARAAGGKPTASWPYHDAAGEEVLRVVRFETGADGKRGKSYRPISRNGEGYRIGDPPGLLPLYRQTEIGEGETVYVVEGEKAADAGRAIGLTTTTSAHGAKSADKTDWSPLADRRVVILPDHDEAGDRYAEEVEGLLTQLTPPAEVRVVHLPGLGESEDLVEFIGARKQAGVDDVKAEIEALADATPIRTPTQDANQAPMSAPPQPFPVDVLPDVLHEYVQKGADAIGCDPSFVALPLLSACAAAIGNSRCIRLKNTWTEPAVIWTVLIAESGSMKSPALALALRSLHVLQEEAFAEHRAAMADYEAARLCYEAELAQWKKQGSSSAPPVKPEAPSADRYVVSDATVEALAVLLQQNPRGLLLARDELSGWIGSFDAYKAGRGGDDAHWLSMWRAEPLTVDRKTGESRTIYVPRAAVSVAGTIQVEILRRQLGQRHFENGLAARMLLAMPEVRPSYWTDDEVSEDLVQAASLMFRRLLALAPEFDTDANPEPRPLALTKGARELFIAFHDRHAVEQSSLSSADLRAVWSKLKGYAARLALVVHCVRLVCEDRALADEQTVDAESVSAGVELARWFANEARRVYVMLQQTEADRGRRDLVELIRRKGGSMSPREVMRSSRQFGADAETVEAALDDVAKHGAGHWRDVPPGPRGGRPTRELVVSPPVDVDTTSDGRGGDAPCAPCVAIPDRVSDCCKEVVSTSTTGDGPSGSDDWGEL